MIIRGRAISPGIGKGEVVKLDDAFSFLGGVDASTGDLRVREGNIAEKVFVFPKGKGSTVGSFVMYDLMVHGKAPSAAVNKSAETIVTTGAVISSTPMVDMIDTDLFRDGDIVYVNGTDGSVSIENVQTIRTVSSAVVRRDGKVLTLRRPDAARSFPGKVSLVCGKIERGESNEQAARRKILEETRISDVHCRATIPPFFVREGDVLWEATAFLFEVDWPEPVLNHENVSYEWIDIGELASCPDLVPGTLEAVRKLMDGHKEGFWHMQESSMIWVLSAPPEQ